MLVNVQSACSGDTDIPSRVMAFLLPHPLSLLSVTPTLGQGMGDSDHLASECLRFLQVLLAAALACNWRGQEEVAAIRPLHHPQI